MQHRAALAYDWRARFGLSLRSIEDGTVPWGEAWDLTSRLLLDPDSHITADLAGWVFVPGPVRQVGADLFEGYVNVNRKKNTTPFRMERAWTKALPKSADRVDVSAQDRAQRARLDQMLGLVKEADEPPQDDDE